MSGINDDTEWGKLSSPGMMNFGDFTLNGQTAHSWAVWEIPIFMIVRRLSGPRKHFIICKGCVADWWFRRPVWGFIQRSTNATYRVSLGTD
jgi:hypothetical protein